MSKTDRFRYTAMSKILTILISAIVTTLIIYGVFPVDLSNLGVAITQILIYTIIQVFIISIVVFILVGRKPKAS